MRHRLMTNGENFRVQTQEDKGEKWEFELEFIACVYSANYRPVTFKNRKAALKWIRKKYGTYADIKEFWQPV